MYIFGERTFPSRLKVTLTFSPSLAAPLVDLTPSHSGSAMLMLLSVVFVGLAVFVIYKFKRYDLPWAISFPHCCWGFVC